MIDLTKLLETQHAEVIGVVKDNKDEEKQSRLRIQISGFNHSIPTDQLEWIEKSTASINNTLDVPAIDEVVYVVATNGQLRWRHMDFFDKEAMDQFVGDDNYLKSLVIAYKNLNKFESNGHFFIGWADSTGFSIVKDDGRIEIRKDNSVLLYNGKQSVHVNEDRISLGSENESLEPAVMGDQNKLSLEMLNDEIKALGNLTKQHMTLLGIACESSNFTKHLKPFVDNFGNNFKSRADEMFNQNNNQFPKTLSKIVSLD